MSRYICTLTHHPVELMEVKFAISVEVVSPYHGLAVLDRPLLAEPAHHSLQSLWRDPPRPLHHLEHLERPPQVILLLPLHQPQEVPKVQKPIAVGVELRDRRLRLLHRHLLAYGAEETEQLHAGDLPIPILIDVAEDFEELIDAIPAWGGGGRRGHGGSGISLAATERQTKLGSLRREGFG